MEKIEKVFDPISAAPRLDTNSQHLLFDDAGNVVFGERDPDNPKHWSAARKIYITTVTILAVVNATFASSAPTGAIDGISEEFGISVEAAGLVTTLFLLGYCAGPLLWAPLSEFYGYSAFSVLTNTADIFRRRFIFYSAFILYLAFNFLCAFAPNFGSLLVGRFISSVGASAALSNGPGIIADLWESVGRGNAMVLFMVATFVGPSAAPVVSGFLQLTKTWRWTFYVLLWLAGITQVLLFTIPETLPKAILTKKARTLKNNGESHESLLSIFSTALTRPWIIFFDPISFCVAVYYCLVYTLLYMLFSIYPIVFQQKRGWNAGVGELPLLGTVVGACLGGLILFHLSMKEHKAISRGEKRTPENRLPPAMVGAVLFAITMFWFAWTAEFDSIHWIVPTLAGTFLATSILLIFAAFINYLIDTYLKYAASAVAVNTVARSACAAASPLFTQYMFDALGVGGGGSLVGGVAVLLAPIPFIFYKYGPMIRQRSSFAPTDV